MVLHGSDCLTDRSTGDDGATLWSVRTRDVVWAAVVAVAVLVSTIVQDKVQGGVQLDFFGAVLILLTGGILAFRSRFPVWVAVGTLLGCAVYYPFVGASGPILATFVVGLYGAAAAGRIVIAVGLAALTMGAIGVGEIFSPIRHVDDIALFMLAGWLVAVIALGTAQHTRRAYVAEAEKRATGEERLRIARELHDVLAHNISLINVQASAALHRKDGGEEALQAIKGASKEALRELRATLGVLRQVDEQAPTAPPGLHQLGELVERTRATGLKVTVDGEPRALPPEVDLAAYRIIQEALTNVSRHARAREVKVRIQYSDKDISVQVNDDGGGGNLVAGNGIRGMTERAQAIGGSLTVRGGADGVLVDARLPIGVQS
jgi:signal transduction histidine kinase